MNKLAVILQLVLLFIYLLDLGSVKSAPTWIPSNVTFERINETHVHVMHKGKLVETINLKENNLEETTTQLPQLPPFVPASQTPSTSEIAADKQTTCCIGNSKPLHLDPLKLELLKKQWVGLHRCYFNPVTCFVGKKN